MRPGIRPGRRVVVGVCCAAVAVVAGWVMAGGSAALAAGTLALVATAMQWIAAVVVERWGGTGRPDRLKVYGAGMLLRFGGVAVLGALVALDRGTFPPVPSAAGYLMAALPLLFLETRPER